MASVAEPAYRPAAALGLGLSEAIAALAGFVRPSVVQVIVHGRGAGAGVIWDSDGGIVTNHHVVGDEPGPVRAVLADGVVLDARVVRRHPEADLALLQVAAGGLRPALLGDSDALRVGQLVFALGHPWGQPGVLTAGIVSGTGALPARWGGRPAQLIRSDVGLAPGNSGGPLVDADGRVVGINSMIFGGDLAVAIPSAVVMDWLAAGT